MNELGHLLLVDDNPGDVLLTEEALRLTGFIHPISVVANGVEAMAYLRRQGRYTECERPDLLLLDLNMPLLDGRGVLKSLKGDPDLCRIPVVVLSTSADPQDIDDSYRLYANCYISKPMDFEDFVSALDALRSFWLEWASLPSRSSAA